MTFEDDVPGNAVVGGREELLATDELDSQIQSSSGGCLTFEDDHSGDEDIPSSLLVAHEESESDDKEEAIPDKSVCAVSTATKEAVCALRHALVERRLIAHLRGPLGGFLSKADAKVTRMRFLHFFECVHHEVVSNSLIKTCDVPALVATKGTNWQIYMAWLLEHGVSRTHLYTDKVLSKSKGYTPSTIINYINDINRVLVWYQLWNADTVVSTTSLFDRWNTLLPTLRKRYNKATKVYMSKGGRTMEAAIANCSLPAGGLTVMQVVVKREIDSLISSIKAFDRDTSIVANDDDVPDVFTKGKTCVVWSYNYSCYT